MFSAAKTSAPASGAYTLTKSLRFRSSASAYLNRTPASTTNRQTWTWSCWVKRANLTSSGTIFEAAVDTNNRTTFYLEGPDGFFTLQQYTSGSTDFNFNTTPIYKDTSAWYHFVIVADTTNATQANRLKFYVNNVLQPVSGTLLNQNLNTYVNSNNVHNIGRYIGGALYLDSYLTDIYLIDGQALTPTSFGAFSATTGVWQPIQYTGTYGTNGFHLAFTNTTSTTTLGYDTSGNGNNWTTNNISLTTGSTYDSMNDVPNVASATASNYAVCNPADTNTNITLSNGNLTFTGTTGSWYAGRQTIGMTSGKWYWEVYCNSISSSPDYRALIGIMSAQGSLGSFVGSDAYGWGYYSSGGDKYHNGSGGGGYGASFGTGDTIGIAFDAGAGTLIFYKNGTSQGTAYSSISSGTYFPALSVYGSTAQVSINFGQQGFTYTPPSGYVALNTYNLPTPTIANGAAYMAATTWVSAGGTESIVNTVNGVSCQPDFVWLKNRSISQNNYLFDSNRGASKYLVSNQNAAEGSDATFLTSFNSNGFSLGTDGFTAGQSIVGWQWQAGKGSTSSNTSGTITSTVSVSTTAGFSVVTFTGTSSNATVGHGLGVAPAMIIMKNRAAADSWQVYHQSLPSAAYRLQLNTTSAPDSQPTVWNSTAPTSSVFSVGTNVGGYTQVAYCFAQIAGFSAFGSYVGNNSSTGPFVYLGFNPKFVLIKYAGSSGGTNWELYDSSRDTYNSVTHNLSPNLDSAEATTYSLSFLSNGFQITSTTSNLNDSGVTYIYAAFASNPFKYSNAF